MSGHSARRHWSLWPVFLLTLASGLFNLFVLVWPRFHGRAAHFLEYSPFEFHHLSRFLTMILGFALSVSSIQVLRRKQRAFHLVVILSASSFVVHLIRGRDYEHSLLSLVVLVLLFLGRRAFTVGSGKPEWRSEGPGMALGALLAMAYGVAGFWLLDRREFGINFTIADSVRRTLQVLSLVADPGISAHTRHARWFLDSLHLMTWTFLGYSALALFRPVIYRLRTHPLELARAREIVERHGRSALDYFKFWPDKSIFFSRSLESFVAYRVAGGYALALGDPVGPDEEAETIVREFLRFCRNNDWGVGFHQTPPDLLPVYEACGLKKLKIGDDAIVDLTTFSLDGRERKSLRHTVHQLEKSGLRTRLVEPPVPEADLIRAHEVSDAWLRVGGRRERGFTLGWFTVDYVRRTPLFFLEEADGTLVAFANIIPSYAPGESTIDLMRHRPDAPNGAMDYLFLALFMHMRERGHTTFNLGMAPMAGFRDTEESTAEARAVHQFFGHLNFLFRYRGLHAYKAKFANSWEPRYAVFQSALELPRLGLALTRVSSIEQQR